MLVMFSENPYQTPNTIPVEPTVSKHRSFHLTLDASESKHFKVGTIQEAIRFAAIQQFAFTLMMGMVLDGGLMLQRACMAAVAFWILALTTSIWRRGDCQDSEILAIKWGYMPVFLITYNVCHWSAIIL